MTPVGIADRIRIVLEQQDICLNAVFPQALLGLVPEVVDDPLTRLVVDDELGNVIALGRRVLGVEPGVEVEARAVLEEDVRVAGAGMTFSKRYRATSSGDRRRWPFRVQVRPYSFSRPKIRRFIWVSAGIPIWTHAAERAARSPTCRSAVAE
jgi:hypothetical protein